MTRSADLIFTGENILTMTRRSPSSPIRAVAVRQGLVVAVGGAEVHELRGPRTEVVELGNQCLLPGFIDSHVHPIVGGLARQRCDLSEVHSFSEYQQLISDYAVRHRGPWVEGAGWYGDIFEGGFPTKELLDQLVPDRPAAFVSHDVHSLWVNSMALDMAGINRGTPDPEGGRITRDPAGVPSGQLMETAIELLDHVRPKVGQEDVREALVAAEQYLHSLGVTAWQDALIGDYFGITDTYDVYAEVSANGVISSRVTGALLWDPRSGAAKLEEVKARRTATAGSRFRTTAIKFLLDGNCENLTAAVHGGYAGRPGEQGILQFDSSTLKEISRNLSEAGFDLHLHAVGDLAVTRAIDAIATTDNRSERRHQIAHIDLILAADLPRMHELAIIANVTPLWARQDPVLVETKLPLLTADQQQRHFLYGSLHAAGVELAFGSDWPVSTPDPIANLHTAANRTAAPNDPHAHDHRALYEPLIGSERLPVEACLAAYTRSAARASRLDEYVGTIEEGKEADLVVLDQDPLKVAPSELGNLALRQTFVRGERVFSS